MNAAKRKLSWGNVPKKKKIFVDDNRFKLLGDYYDDESSIDNIDEAKNYKIIIPPLVVDKNHGFQTVYDLIGKPHQFKKVSVGTKVLSDSIAQYEDAKNKLIKADFTFYSHDSVDTKLFKMVLYGLPQMDTQEICKELQTTYKITPVSIRELNTKLTTKDDALYIVEFDRSNTTKSSVYKIKYLGHIVVHWKKSFKKVNGPTQCTKCAMYGHGSRNCFRNKVCIACGADHDVSICNIIKEPTVNSPSYKCFNCTKNNLKNVNHRADDPKCPSRRDYLSIRNRRITAPRQAQRHFSLNDEYFPQIPNSQNTNSQVIEKIQSQMKYSEAASASYINQNVSTDLFSLDELLKIFTEATVDLRKCTTKMEQITVIMNLLKYAV